MTFEETIKAIRKQRALSQEAFSRELGVSFSTVNRWENGKAKPNYDTLRRISNYCDLYSIKIRIDSLL